MLELQLKKSGAIILPGDLYRRHDNREFRRVPDFNCSRAETLVSIDRIERTIARPKARIVVQHDLADFNAMPNKG